MQHRLTRKPSKGGYIAEKLDFVYTSIFADLGEILNKNMESTEQNAPLAHLNTEQRDMRRREHLHKNRDSLVARLGDGDRQAAAELVDIYYEQIYLFMRRLGHGRHISQDLTQESFLQAWRHIAQLRSSKALNGWLYQIVANVSRRYWRGHKATVPLDVQQLESSHTGEDGFAISQDAEQLRRVNDAVTGLSFKLRQAIVLHYMQQLTIAEAAEAADVTLGTFKSRLNRALKALRKQLGGEKGQL